VKKRIRLVLPGFLLLVILSLLVQPGFSQDGELSVNYKLSTAAQLSRITDRPMMFSFVHSGCGACQYLKNMILAADEVKEVIDQHYVFSLISIDSTYTLELPEAGKMSNLQLFNSLGASVTPTTFYFFPPDPGLSDRYIIGGPGVLNCNYLSDYPEDVKEFLGMTEYCKTGPEDQLESNVGLMKNMLTRIGRLKEDGTQPTGDDVKFYNYRVPVKKINETDFKVLRDNMTDIPVVSEPVPNGEVTEKQEIILNFPETGGMEEYADSLISDGVVEKVYIVTSPEDDQPENQGSEG